MDDFEAYLPPLQKRRTLSPRSIQPTIKIPNFIPKTKNSYSYKYFDQESLKSQYITLREEVLAIQNEIYLLEDQLIQAKDHYLFTIRALSTIEPSFHEIAPNITSTNQSYSFQINQMFEEQQENEMKIKEIQNKISPNAIELLEATNEASSSATIKMKHDCEIIDEEISTTNAQIQSIKSSEEFKISAEQRKRIDRLHYKIRELEMKNENLNIELKEMGNDEFLQLEDDLKESRQKYSAACQKFLELKNQQVAEINDLTYHRLHGDQVDMITEPLPKDLYGQI